MACGIKPTACGIKPTAADRLFRSAFFAKGRPIRVAAEGRAMNVSDSGETDAHILTPDVPDDALERAAAGIAPGITWVTCTSNWFDCVWPQ